MSNKASVNLRAVKSFKLSVKSCADHSVFFKKSIACLGKYGADLNNYSEILKKSIDGLISAKQTIDEKTELVKSKVLEQQERISCLQSTVDEIREEISNTPESFDFVDEDGNTYSEANSSFCELCNQLEMVQTEIANSETEMSYLRDRLGKINELKTKIQIHLVQLQNDYQILRKYYANTLEYKKSIEKIQLDNEKYCDLALTGLDGIIRAVEKYIGARIKYDSQNEREKTSTRINLNININSPHHNSAEKAETVEKAEQDKPQFGENTQEEILKHDIKFNQSGRIISYDGKKYGGIYNTYEDRLGHTSDNDSTLGHYIGERGESKYVPYRSSAKAIRVIEILEKYCLDGIEYRNAEPDFEVCSEAVVTIEHMTADRDYNFNQADEKCAELWNMNCKLGRSDWLAEDIECFRKQNRYTWHEKCDLKTMVMVPTEINEFFKHAGGVSECKMRDGVVSEGVFL